jgi:hypothetical protein
MTIDALANLQAESRRESRRTIVWVVVLLAVFVALECAYPLLTHKERACPEGQYPVVGAGPQGETGVCVPHGTPPPRGLHFYPRHKVPVLATDVYRPTRQDYLQYGGPRQRKIARLSPN